MSTRARGPRPRPPPRRLPFGLPAPLGIPGATVGPAGALIVPEAPLPGTEAFRSGASEADGAPAMWVGTFGHGPEARQALGRRGRLRCRCVSLEDAQGERIAFAARDLLGAVRPIP